MFDSVGFDDCEVVTVEGDGEVCQARQIDQAESTRRQILDTGALDTGELTCISSRVRRG